MDQIHKQKIVVKQPFENVKNIYENEEAKNTFMTIVQFVYHYTKEEMRMQPIIKPDVKNDTWENIKELFN